MRFFLILLSLIVLFCCETNKNCDGAIWNPLVSMDSIGSLEQGRLYKLDTPRPFTLPFNSVMAERPRDGYGLSRHRVVGYVDASCDSLVIKKIGDFSFDTFEVVRDSNFVYDYKAVYPENRFGYLMDTVFLWRYTIFGDWNGNCLIDTTRFAKELSIAIYPDDSVQTILKVYSTIEEGYGHYNNYFSNNYPIHILIDDRKY